MYVYMAYNWADIGYYCNNYICKFFNFCHICTNYNYNLRI